MVRIIVNKAVMKGNHEINNTPPLAVSLNVDFEYGEVGPLLVWLPNSELPTEAHNASSDDDRVPFGHVPSGLSPSFKNIINQGGTISAIATGLPRDSFHPWPGRYSPGGGKVIPCDTYIIKTDDHNDCVSSLQFALDNMPEGSAMTLSVSET